MSVKEMVEFYEENAENMWGHIHDQVDPLTFYKLSKMSEDQSVKVTCAKGEIEWLAKIIAEVR